MNYFDKMTERYMEGIKAAVDREQPEEVEIATSLLVKHYTRRHEEAYKLAVSIIEQIDHFDAFAYPGDEWSYELDICYLAITEANYKALLQYYNQLMEFYKNYTEHGQEDKAYSVWKVAQDVFGFSLHQAGGREW